MQVKLLRALEDREIRRIGGQQPFRVDVRLISATNRDLTDLVAEGDFREDLLYRINVVTLTVPPLRRRREDIRPLADRFIARACEEHGRAVARVDPRFYEALEACDWPGNVRQLRNVVESAVLLSSGDALSPDVVPLPEGAGRRTVAATGAFAAPDGMSLAEIEREVLLQTLTRCQGNRTLSAERLGLSRRTVQRKIKEHGLPF